MSTMIDSKHKPKHKRERKERESSELNEWGRMEIKREIGSLTKQLITSVNPFDRETVIMTAKRCEMVFSKCTGNDGKFWA